MDHEPIRLGRCAMNNPPLVCEKVVRSFREGDARLDVLRGVDLEVGEAETLAITGASGAGKTTLLQILGGLDAATSGNVKLFGEDFSGSNPRRRGQMRNRWIGFVYQFHHLLPEFSALENVAMPLLIRRLSSAEVRKQAGEMLSRVGLAERLHHRPGELSGGERQRVAVARALVTHPAVVLADEPTGNLDQETGDRVLDLMLELNGELGASLVVVTHDMDLAARMQRILHLDHGVLNEKTQIDR